MRLVAAGPEHVAPLAVIMREADRIEVGALGRSPESALRTALSSSVWALTAMVDDEPHAMMGVASRSMIEGIGTPWMLGSERIYDSARLLVRHGPAIIAEMRSSFERLENVVHVGNHRALRFLRHFGFEISGTREVIGALEFVRFSNVRASPCRSTDDRQHGGHRHGAASIRTLCVSGGEKQSAGR